MFLLSTMDFQGTFAMKLVGFFLLISGWLIVLATLALLASLNLRLIFLIAGLAIEMVGVVLVARSHLVLEDEAG